MASSPALPSWLVRAELVVLGVALAVRLIALARFEASPMSRHPMVDAYTYWSQAQELFNGGDPFARDGFYQPPAYPWILAKLGAVAGGMDLGTVRQVQLLLGMITTWMVLRLGRRVAAATGVPWAGLVAGALFGLFPSVVMFEHDILTPAMSLAAFVGGLLLMLAAQEHASPGARGWAVLAVGGLLLGVSAAIHPTLLLGALPVLVVTALGLRRSPARVLGLVLAVSAPFVPTTVENLDRFGAPTLVSHNAGINLYLGNNANFRETMFFRPGLPFRQLALEAEPADRDLPARNAYWKDRVWSEAWASPRVAASVLAVKALWSVNTTEIPRNEDYRCRTRPGESLGFLRWIPVRFGLVFPFALIGAVVAVRRRREVPALAVLPVTWIALHVPLILFFPTDRYRLASWPVVVVLAAWGLTVAVRDWRQVPRPAAILAVLGLVLAHWPIDPRTDMDPALCRYAEGNLHYMEQEWAEAEAAYTDMLKAHPDDVGAHGWLASLAERRKDYPTAIQHMDVVIRQFPDHFPSLKSMADYHYYSGDKAGCVVYLKRAYAVPGNRTNTGVKLVKLLRKMGRTAEAQAIQDADPKLKGHPKLTGG